MQEKKVKIFLQKHMKMNHETFQNQHFVCIFTSIQNKKYFSSPPSRLIELHIFVVIVTRFGFSKFLNEYLIENDGMMIYFINLLAIKKSLVLVRCLDFSYRIVVVFLAKS